MHAMNKLSAELLARRDRLPIKPAPITLTGKLVELRPLDLDADSDAPRNDANRAGIGPRRHLGMRSSRYYAASVMLDCIVSSPGVLGGKPCIRETRISVEHILELLDSGAVREDILRAYPQVTAEGLI